MVKKVVLIDDDQDDASLFKEALQEVNEKVAVEYFEGCLEALNNLNSEGHQLPDIIFLDINMPVVNGWYCLEEFKRSEKLASVPVYIYTTSSHKKEKERALTMGATGFITKPMDYNELKNILREILS